MRHQFFILFFLVCACTQTEKRKSVPNDGVSITCRFEVDKTDIATLVDGAIEYVPLQTNKESLIGKISNIRYNLGKYYIMDEQQESVIIFNDKGNHISTLDRKGKGPCEYSTLYDMRLNRDSIVEILGKMNPTKLIRYSKSDLGCKELQIKDHILADQFMPIDRGYIFYQASGAFEKKNRYFIFITDEEGNIEKKYLPSYRDTGYSVVQPNNFYMLDDTVMFYMPRDEHIYQITQQGEMSVRYFVDFGKHHLPDEIKELYEKDFHRFREESLNYASGPYDICESPTHVFFSYTEPHQESNTFFTCFHKKNKTVSTFQVHDILSEALLMPFAVTDDGRFISCIDPADLKYISREKYPTLMSIYDTLPEDANPVLLLYKIKSL